jgi:PAS domain S-box-containing protein
MALAIVPCILSDSIIAQNNENLRGDLTMIKDLSSTDLEAFFEAIPIRITILDANNNIQGMNTEAWSRVKVNVEERVGNSILDCHSPESASNVMKVIEDLKSGREKIVRKIFQPKDSNKAYQEFYTAILDKEGNFLGTLHLMYDISEEFRLRQELEELKLKNLKSGETG